MNKAKDCCLCNSAMTPIWSIKNGVAPNLYLKDSSQEQTSTQDLMFCEECQIIENVHHFSEDNLFGDYVYRTPATNMDDEIVEFLSSYIKKNNIKNVVEVAGNNATFAKKILNMLPEEDNLKYTIIDKVPLEHNDSRLFHVNAFLTKSELNNIPNLDCQLVIVRHALAHNKNVLNFFKDINEILKPNQIYIENASLISTYEKKDYSQLYSEHFFSLSPFFVKKMGELFNFKTSDIKEFKIHNGSFGIMLDKNSDNTKIQNQLTLSSVDLRNSILEWTIEVHDFWAKLKKKNINILVWGCSAKFLFTYSALNLKNIVPVSFIVDSTPEKNNLYAPGTSVQVSSEEIIENLDNDIVFVIGARNFREFIEPKILEKLPNAEIYCPPF